MFDIGWSEMMVVGVVALIVVGPKDLPKMFHAVGEMTGKARAMAREFQRAMDAAARETGVSDIARDLHKHSSGQSLKDAVGFGDIEKQFKSMGHDKPDLRKPGMTPSPGKADAPGKAGTPGKAEQESHPDPIDVEDADEAAVAAHDATFQARNAQASEVEKLRLIKVKKAEAARMKAAAIRARKEAEAAAREVEQAEAEARRPKAAAQPTEPPTSTHSANTGPTNPGPTTPPSPDTDS